MIWGNRSSAGRGRAVFCGPGLADRPEGAKEAWRLLLPAPSGRERGERAGARCRSRGILCQIKRIPLDNPEEKFWEGFRFPSQTPLETTKGEACGPLLWKPLRGMRRIFGTKDVGTGVRGGVVAAIQGVLPCGGRSWGGLGSSGAGIGWLRPRGGRGRHAVPRAWPPPTKFRHEIWGVGQGRRALRVGRGKFPRSSGGSGVRRSGQRRGEGKKHPLWRVLLGVRRWLGPGPRRRGSPGGSRRSRGPFPGGRLPGAPGPRPASA